MYSKIGVSTSCHELAYLRKRLWDVKHDGQACHKFCGYADKFCRWKIELDSIWKQQPPIKSWRTHVWECTTWEIDFDVGWGFE